MSSELIPHCDDCERDVDKTVDCDGCGWPTCPDCLEWIEGGYFCEDCLEWKE